MPTANPTLQRLLDKWPGKKYFGIYRFLPLFFVLGAALEFSMINWHFGETNFYRTFKRRKAHEIAESTLNQGNSVV
ncbi:small integral membrane protein 4 [Ischnura elegans]|uniref:small integral membrane protein 4 n=1 Tax=Ischnura elegans TaxID=197161 RepID=UPI001ED8666E|nr:small integral membrane protein 4 [Ischnura elegans]